MEPLTLVLVLGLVILVALGASLLWIGAPRGPSLTEVQHLTTPHVLEMGPQRVLQVRARGDPNVVGRAAFGLLLKTYFRLKGVPKGGPSFRPPRARWSVQPGSPKEEWEGVYAMPLPDSVQSVPESKETAHGLSVEVATWEYGTVAQVLHVGRYDQEQSTVEGLLRWLGGLGYVVAGPHEEEYLKGPGMLFPGDPDRYLTLIRYPVRKAGTP